MAESTALSFSHSAYHWNLHKELRRTNHFLNFHNIVQSRLKSGFQSFHSNCNTEEFLFLFGLKRYVGEESHGDSGAVHYFDGGKCFISRVALNKVHKTRKEVTAVEKHICFSWW